MFVRDSCSKQLDSDRLAADVPDFMFDGQGSCIPADSCNVHKHTRLFVAMTPDVAVVIPLNLGPADDTVTAE